MRNKLFILLFVLSVAFQPFAFAAVGSLEDGNMESIDTDINWSTNLDHSASGSVGTVSVSNSPVFSGDVTFNSTLIALGRAGGASTAASSSTNLAPANLPYLLLRKYVGGGGGLDSTPGTTLQNGTSGQVLILQIAGLQSGGTWVVTPTTKTGFNSITFDTKGDQAMLIYINDTIGWILGPTQGITISQA